MNKFLKYAGKLSEVLYRNIIYFDNRITIQLFLFPILVFYRINSYQYIDAIYIADNSQVNMNYY